MNSPTKEFFDRDSSDIEVEEEKSWITRFCNKEKNCYFCEVEDEFITDAFNLYGINNDFHLYKQALGRVLGEYDSDGSDSEIDEDELENNAIYIYGMIHARYIVTLPGMEAMLHKYKTCIFGTCPRVYCNHQHLLPMGESDLPNISKLRLFCPCCKELYYPQPPFDNLDGAFFGTSFPHLFLLNYPEYVVEKTPSFAPTVYGYHIHESSPYYNKEAEKDKKEV